MRAWQAKWVCADTSRFAHSIFPNVTLRPWFRAKRRREVLFALRQGFYLDIALFDRIFVDFELLKIWCVCMCAGDYETVDHLIWHCERFRLERHRLIDALAALNVSIEIPIRDLCALKKWCIVKCCLDSLRGIGMNLWWFSPSSAFEGLEMYSLGPSFYLVLGTFSKKLFRK
jgi:hypothetical protein